MTRVIGRILSLGYPMPGVLVDNYTFVSAPSFFDYDALVCDQAALSALFEVIAAGGEATTFAGAAVRLQAATSGEASLRDLVERRREETERLLERGGAVVVFAQPSRTHDIGGAPWCSYDWLPDSARPHADALLAGEGSQADVVDWSAPLAGYVASQAANIAYRAYFREGPTLRVFARSAGGAAVGAEVAGTKGRVFLLPALRTPPGGEARYSASDALQAGIRRALDAMAPGHEPPWVAAHPLPGLAEARERRDAARLASRAAAETEADAEGAYAGLADMQALLWQEGRAGLDGAVIAALRALGADVDDRHANELAFRSGDARTLFEIEGSERPVEMAAHHRLRQRIERAIERGGGPAPRGVLFVNGERLKPPTERTHVTAEVRTAATMMRYCIAPTCGLYEAYAAMLDGDAGAGTRYLARVAATDGILEATGPA